MGLILHPNEGRKNPSWNIYGRVEGEAAPGCEGGEGRCGGVCEGGHVLGIFLNSKGTSGKGEPKRTKTKIPQTDSPVIENRMREWKRGSI